MTEQKQQHVPSAIDKTELTYWLEEAGKLNSSDYTKDGWDIFRQIVTEATGVKDDATATEHEVSEAVIALIDGMIALEKEKVYTVRSGCRTDPAGDFHDHEDRGRTCGTVFYRRPFYGCGAGHRASCLHFQPYLQQAF